VSTVAVSYPVGNITPTPANATFQVATAGTYRLHVLGVPSQIEAAGSFGVRIAPATGGAPVLDVADAITANPQFSGNESIVTADFAIATAGNYQLTVTDQAFPAPLASAPQVVLLQQNPNSAPTPVLSAPGPFAAQAGTTYSLIVIATADATARAGLFSVDVSAGSPSTRVFHTTRGVGRMPPAAEVNLSAGQYTLTLTDMGFPATLETVHAAIVQQDTTNQDTIIGSLAAAGNASITAAPGVAQVFGYATASTPLEVGAYALALTQGTQVALEATRIVDNSSDPMTPAIFSVTSPSAVAAGSHRITLKDFGFPTAFAQLQAAVTQRSTVLGQLNAPGELTLALQAAPVKVLIATRPPASGGSGLFAVQVTGQTSGARVLETTQGTGGIFHAIPVTIPSAGRYDFTLADLEFPSALGSSALAVTQDTSVVGQIFGAGTLTGQQLSPGTYVLNFQGAPATNSTHGTYGLRVTNSPAAPALTFSAASTSIASGQQTTLQWSTMDATACSASNGWSGTKATSGSQTVGPLSASTTYELSCTGPGGTANASVAIGVAAANASSKKGGGGGSNDLVFIALLGIAAALHRCRSTA
jgi:hypothetical protein